VRGPGVQAVGLQIGEYERLRIRRSGERDPGQPAHRAASAVTAHDVAGGHDLLPAVAMAVVHAGPRRRLLLLAG
jgi:hypothetical protein